MTRPFVLVTAPVAEDAAQVAGILNQSSGLRHRSRLRLGRLLDIIETQLRSRDGLERSESGDLPAWIQAAVSDYISLLPSLNVNELAVVDAPQLWHRPALLQTLAAHSLVLAVVDAPRRVPAADPHDPVPHLQAWGTHWARSVLAVQSHVPQVTTLHLWRSDAHNTLADMVRQILGKPLRSRLPVRPPIALDPTLEAVFRAHPLVEQALQSVGLPLPPKADDASHPAIALIRAEAAIEQGELETARALVSQAGAQLPAALIRARLHRLAGEATLAEEQLRPFLDAGRGTDGARLEALASPFTRLSEDVAAAVDANDSESVRIALAHWLVHRGMDPDAAELVAWVEGTGWYTGIRTRS